MPNMMNRWWLYLLGSLILIFLVAPALLIVPMSFSSSAFLEFPPPGWSLQWHHAFLESRPWMTSLMVSLKVAVINMFVSVTIGTMAAYGLAQSRWKYRKVVVGILMTPLIFPVILIAIGLFYLYAKVHLLNTVSGLVLAHAALSVPLSLTIVTAAFRSFDFEQEKAAMMLGASRIHAFFTVTLPQVRPAIISAALFAFLTSFDEVVVSTFISGGAQTTLTKRMFTALRDIMDPTIAAISTWVLVLTCITLLATHLFSPAPKSR